MSSNQTRGKSSRVRIAVRVRPLSEAEESEGHTSVLERINDNGVRVWDPMAIEAGLIRGDVSSNGNCWIRDFYYDYCLWSFSDDDKNYADQSTIFSVVGQPVVNWTMEHYNTCILAYGQTGAGKSYTMLGSYRDPSDYGLIPRICFALFDRLDSERGAEGEYFVDLSFLEIYNETLRDCLNPSTNSGLRLRENTSEGVYVSNLTREQVHCFEDVMTLIAKGNKYRTVAATNANARSSRSHAIVTLTIRQRYRSSIINGLPSSSLLQKTSKMHLVDLAGSERSSHSGATGIRLREANNINRSLSVLGDVIKFLGEGKGHIPYRNSSLTMVLKESLGGNSHTTIIAAVSPSNRDYNETISTLKYADSAKRIKMHVAANVTSGISIADGANAIQLVPLLQAEVAKLKEMLQEQQTRRPPSPPLSLMQSSTSPPNEAVMEMKARVEELERQLLEREDLIRRLGEGGSGDLGNAPGLVRTTSMSSDINEPLMINTSAYLNDESMESSRKSIVHPLVLLPDDPVNINLPRIVNLNQDPLFSECLVYYIPEGFIVAGNDEANVDIFLSGPDLLSKHCVFHNHGGVVYIGPTREVDLSPTSGERGRLFINGVDINGLREQSDSWRHPDPSVVIEGGLMRLSNYDRIAIGKYHLFRFENSRNKSPRALDVDKAFIPDWEFAHHELLPHIINSTAITASLTPPRVPDSPIMSKKGSPKKVQPAEDTRRVRFLDEATRSKPSAAEHPQSQADFRKMMRQAFQATAEQPISKEAKESNSLARRFADIAIPDWSAPSYSGYTDRPAAPHQTVYDRKVVVEATQKFDDEVESLQNELSRMHQNLQERMKKYKAMSRT